MTTTARKVETKDLKWNVWDKRVSRQGSTGPWDYLCTAKAVSEDAALDIVAVRYGIKREDLKAYPHLDNFEEVA